ncbi:MAG: YaiO family outer membrane beta-barrel protein [Candidatus Marinimicrobia bacterium]|nr:YaiO family outer membrane beta-barrel protein [Candidatus Neomarinimicrobiota bacterium]
MNRILISIVFCSTVNLIGAARDQGDSRKTVYLQQAAELIQTGDFEAAVFAYERLMDLTPTSYDVLFGYARALSFSGQRQKGIEVYTNLLDQFPNDPDALLGRGRVHAWEKHYEASEKDLLYVTDNFPDYLDAWVALSDLYTWWSKYPNAIEVLNHLIKVQPESPDYYIKRSKVFKLDRHFSTARNDLLKATDLGGDKKIINQFLQQLARVTAPTRWSATLDYDNLSYSDDRDTWHTFTTSLKREFKSGTLILKGLRTRRFGEWDRALVIDSYLDAWTGAYANITYQHAINRQFLPTNTFRLEIYQGFASSWEVSGTYGRMNFPKTKVNLYSLLLAKYAGPWYIRSRVLLVPLPDKSSQSYSLSVRRYLGNVDDFIDAVYGWSTVQENIKTVDDLTHVQSQSFLIRFEKKLIENIIVTAQYSTRSEKNSYTTQSINVGTTYRW